MGIESLCRLGNGWHRNWISSHRPHPVLGWSLREGFVGNEGSTRHLSRISWQGIRDEYDLKAKEHGERRLLIVGDSVTYGMSVGPRQTYPYRLERELESRGRPWRILNGGVIAYDPSQEADWLSEFGWRLEPERLAIAFCPNDLYRSARTGDHLGAYVSNRMVSWLVERSLATHYLQKTILAGWVLGSAGFVANAPDPAAPANGPNGWELLEPAYQQIAQQAKRRGVPVVLLIFPTLDHLEHRAADTYSLHLETLADELGWSAIAMHQPLETHARGCYLENDSLHLSPLGNRLSARYLADELLATGWLR